VLPIEDDEDPDNIPLSRRYSLPSKTSQPKPTVAPAKTPSQPSPNLQTPNKPPASQPKPSPSIIIPSSQNSVDSLEVDDEPPLPANRFLQTNQPAWTSPPISPVHNAVVFAAQTPDEQLPMEDMDVHHLEIDDESIF
jgi:hypothetical protein